MAKFQIVQEISVRNHNVFIKNFEKKIEAEMNNGWKLVNCSLENGVVYAFMQKE